MPKEYEFDTQLALILAYAELGLIISAYFFIIIFIIVLIREKVY